jgi:hypothetical protein
MHLGCPYNNAFCSIHEVKNIDNNALTLLFEKKNHLIPSKHPGENFKNLVGPWSGCDQNIHTFRFQEHLAPQALPFS